MKTGIIGRQYLAVAVVSLIVAAGVFAKLLHDTRADSAANMADAHADYDAIRATAIYRATLARERPEASTWTACAGVQDSAVQVIERVRTQIGIIFLSSVVNVAIADGCAMDAKELGGERLEQAFDERPHAWRWPVAAAAVHAWYGRSEEQIAAYWRVELAQERAVAECVGRSARRMREATTDRPHAELVKIHDACQRAA